MNEEWGPWIEHDGKGLPKRVRGALVITIHQLSTGRIVERKPAIAGAEGGHSWDWRNARRYSRLLRYRVRQPRGLSLLRRIAENPERERIEA